MTEKLRPCPFCGGNAVLIIEGASFYGAMDFYVFCESCKCTTRSFVNCHFCELIKCDKSNCPEEAAKQAEEYSIKAWNRRANND